MSTKDPVSDPAHFFKVPEKKDNESYAQKMERINAHNYNFFKRNEQRVKDYKGTPPIYKDEEGKYFWPNRAQRRKLK